MDPLHHPTLLFDLNGVLVQPCAAGEAPGEQLPPFRPRPGLRHILSLLPYFRIGLYTSATKEVAQDKLCKIWDFLCNDEAIKAYSDSKQMGIVQGAKGVPKAVFSVVLHRSHCPQDTGLQSRQGEGQHDSDKPLALNDLDLTRTILVDHAACKLLPSELGNAVIVPEFSASSPASTIEPHDSPVTMKPAPPVAANEASETGAHAATGAGEQEGRSMPVLRILVNLLLTRVAGFEGDIRPALQGVQRELEHALSTGVLPDALKHVEAHPAAPGPQELAAIFTNGTPAPLMPDQARTQRRVERQRAREARRQAARKANRTESAAEQPAHASNAYFSDTLAVPADPYARPTLLFDLNGVLVQPRGTELQGRHLGMQPFHPRPGLRHILSLLPHFRTGIYTSASRQTVHGRLGRIWDTLCQDPVLKAYFNSQQMSVGSSTINHANSIFCLVFSRTQCRPDDSWRSRPDGKPHDTVKPLAMHGFDLARTIIVDDSARKILQTERPSALVVPAFFAHSDPAFAAEPEDVPVAYDPRVATSATATAAGDAGVAGELPQTAGRRRMPTLRVLVDLLLAHVAGVQGDVRPGLQRVRQDLEQVVSTGVFPECLKHLRDRPQFPGPRELPLLFNVPSLTLIPFPANPQPPPAATVDTHPPGLPYSFHPMHLYHPRASADAADAVAAATAAALAAAAAGPHTPAGTYTSAAFSLKRECGGPPRGTNAKRGSRHFPNSSGLTAPSGIPVPPGQGGEAFVGHHPESVVLFDLAALVDTRSCDPTACTPASGGPGETVEGTAEFVLRPGVLHLASLLPCFRLGACSAWQRDVAHAAAAFINSFLWTQLQGSGSTFLPHVMKYRGCYGPTPPHFIEFIISPEDGDVNAAASHVDTANSSARAGASASADACSACTPPLPLPAYGLDPQNTIICTMKTNPYQKLQGSAFRSIQVPELPIRAGLEGASLHSCPAAAAAGTSPPKSRAAPAPGASSPVDVDACLNTHEKQFPVLRVLCSSIVASWGAHAVPEWVPEVVSDAQTIMDKVAEGTFVPPSTGPLAQLRMDPPPAIPVQLQVPKRLQSWKRRVREFHSRYWLEELRREVRGDGGDSDVDARIRVEADEEDDDDMGGGDGSADGSVESDADVNAKRARPL